MSRASPGDQEMGKSTMTFVPMAQRRVGFQKPTIVVGYCTPKRCLVMIAASLVVGSVVLRSLYSFRHAFSDMHLRTDNDGELVIISPEIADKHGAVCLDGTSTPGYYIRRGIDGGERRWLLVIPHSRWCNSLTECHSRAQVPMEGTMEGVPVTYQFSGILSSDPSENGYFADWNMVLLVPCDAGSFLGNLTTELVEQGSRLKLRGAAILAASIEHLLTYTSISHARELVLYGKKSGAVSALAYSNYIKRRFAYIPKFTTLLHSGLLLDVDKPHYNMQTFFHLHNIKGNSLLSNCHSVKCLQADRVIARPRTSHIIIYTSAHPRWPLHTLYGCDRQGSISCVKQGFSAKYKKNLINLHPAKRPIKRLVTIITSCGWPFKTTVTHDDPTIDGRSIYAILVKNLRHPAMNAIYVDARDCDRE